MGGSATSPIPAARPVIDEADIEAAVRVQMEGLEIRLGKRPTGSLDPTPAMIEPACLVSPSRPAAHEEQPHGRLIVHAV